MSDGQEGPEHYYIYLISLSASHTRFLIPHLSFPPFFLSPASSRYILLLAGDLSQWHLPVGMKDLNLCGTKVKGKATSE